MAIDLLLKEASSLPEESIMQLLQYVRFLKYQLRSNDESGELLPVKRTGRATGILNLPDDFDEHFEDDAEVIANMFYGDSI